MGYWDGDDGGYPDDYPYVGVGSSYDDLLLPGGHNLNDEDLRDYDEEAYNRQLMEDPDGS